MWHSKIWLPAVFTLLSVKYRPQKYSADVRRYDGDGDDVWPLDEIIQISRG